MMHPSDSSDINIEVALAGETVINGDINFRRYEVTDSPSTTLIKRQPQQPINKPDEKTAQYIEQDTNPPQTLYVTESLGPGILDLGNYSMSGKVSMSGGTIYILSDYQSNLAFSDDSSDNSYSVPGSQNVGAVTLSQAAPTIYI